MGIRVFDDMPTDLRPVKDCSGWDVGGWVFDDIENSANGNASSRACTNPKLGDADELADDDYRSRRNIDLRDEVDSRAFSNGYRETSLKSETVPILQRSNAAIGEFS